MAHGSVFGEYRELYSTAQGDRAIDDLFDRGRRYYPKQQENCPTPQRLRWTDRRDAQVIAWSLSAKSSNRDKYYRYYYCDCGFWHVKHTFKRRNKRG